MEFLLNKEIIDFMYILYNVKKYNATDSKKINLFDYP